MASSSSGGDVRSWRTAFLTLRDEALASPPPSAILSLLRDLVISHPLGALAAAHLPPHEVNSDVSLLIELASAAASLGRDANDVLFGTCHLIHDVSQKVFLEASSSSLTTMLSFLGKILDNLSSISDVDCSLGGTTRMKLLSEIAGILRSTMKMNVRQNSSLESMEVLKLLLHLFTCIHTELLSLYQLNDTSHNEDSRNIKMKKSSLWDLQTLSLSMILDALNGIGSSLSISLWQSVVEVLRKVMDFLASKSLLIENNAMSRFYATLLNCLHCVLSEPKGSLSGHVAGFVAALQMFFMYGLSSRTSSLPTSSGSEDKQFSLWNMKSGPRESKKSIGSVYRPPHLRHRKDETNIGFIQNSSDCEHLRYGVTSSDSDHSDNDKSMKLGDRYRSSKVRLAAILCIQDLCHADPKSLTSFWTLLLPENDVLQPKRHPTTLMNCLIFDPVIKIRIESASALTVMLDGHSLTLLQVAEYKESSRCGSFTTLSCSLGEKLMQLHIGMLHLLQRETHGGLLASLFKVILLLISATPYARMPVDLLPKMITSLHTWVAGSLSSKSEQIGLLVNALSCLSASLSRSPPSLHVLHMLEEDISRGSLEHKEESSVIYLLLHLSERKRSLSIIYEALQALRAVSHNYPSLVIKYWEHISSIVHEILDMGSSDDCYCPLAASHKDEFGKPTGAIMEKCIMAAVKVLDECLRAISGFQGADDLLECRLLDNKQIADFTRTKRVSSAPSYELDASAVLNNNNVDRLSGVEQWREVILKHLPQALSHNSPLVRASSVTCFAGMTSSVFTSLTEDEQIFIISKSVAAAMNDAIPSVRSAACRAIGVMTCFPHIFNQSSIVNEFTRAADYNTYDPVASVRITASWAVANICDSLRRKAIEYNLENYQDGVAPPDCISMLVESALRLTRDGDKIKSNAVRALGNLSRFIQLSEHSAIGKQQRNSSKLVLYGDPHWIERMVQSFVSCVTTGNVKVQWNVCHALSNLFMNETANLGVMSWTPTVYSVLLLLLRDSTNFKIRIHAAIALAVPTSRLDYGTSFPDVVQSLVHVRESLASNHVLTTSGFKYRDNLEKQVNLTALHVLGFVTPHDQALKDFLTKKASHLEEWFKLLCSSVMESESETTTSEGTSTERQDNGLDACVSKKLLTTALKSLLDFYKSSAHRNIIHKFENLDDILTQSH